MSNISEQLKNYLIEKEILIKDIELSTKISHSRISDYINNKATPSVKNLIKLADYFDCSTDYLLGLVEEDKFKNFVIGISFNVNEFINRYNLVKNGKSDYSVAKELNINNGVIANWKAGHSPNVETLVALADLLGTSVDYLIGRSNVQ